MSLIIIREFIEQDRCQLRNIYLETRQQVFSWLDVSFFKLEDFDKDTE